MTTPIDLYVSQSEPNPANDLMPDTLRGTLPLLYAQEAAGDEGIVHVKYFAPDANWTWYATEFDGTDEFFGLVIGLEPEFGYFSLAELNDIRGRLGLKVERDLHFTPKTLREIKQEHHILW